MACSEDPDIGRRGSLSSKKATISHGLAGTTSQRSKTSQSEERRTFTSSKPTTTTTRAPSNIPENSRSSSFDEPAGLVEDYYYFSDDAEKEEQPMDPFTKDPSKFLFVPGIQESRKGGVESESNNFGLDRAKSEEEFGRKIDSSPSAAAVADQHGRFEPQGLQNRPGISFNEEGESNLFDVLSQLDL